MKKVDDEDPRRTDEVTWAREVLDGVQRSLLDRYERRALCPRLPLVIAKPRRARFSPFPSLSLALLSSFALVRPLPSSHPLGLYLYPVDLANLAHPSPLSTPLSASFSSRTRLNLDSALSLSHSRPPCRPRLSPSLPVFPFSSACLAFPTLFPPFLRTTSPRCRAITTAGSLHCACL